MEKTILFIDFDGVIHAYRKGWSGPDIIDDEPVRDAKTGKNSIQWLRELIRSGKFKIHIWSRRGREGAQAMAEWLVENGLEVRYLKEITFEDDKPPAHIFIDDRAIGFQGHFPGAFELSRFTPFTYE